MVDYSRFVICATCTLVVYGSAFASKVNSVSTLDNQHLEIHFLDGVVHHEEGPKGEGMNQGHESRSVDRVETFGKPLNIAEAIQNGAYTVQSSDDPNYLMPKSPVKVFRKTKVNGTAWKWPEPDLTSEHTLYLQLPTPLVEGAKYTIRISESTNADKGVNTLKFNSYSSLSEAIRVNLVGANPDFTVMKSADLYAWMGDGGQRNFSSFAGKNVEIVESKSGRRHTVGKVAFWKSSAKELGNWNLTGSDVWNCDFSPFKGTGKFRLAIQGIGISREFELRRDAFYKPFRTSLLGFYYMRIGEPLGLTPPPRQPQFIPGKSPAGFRVIRTTLSPWHPDWKTLPGDPWDVKDWSKYVEPGSPTNPNAYGGHSDALDWDRHLGHISIIWDLLLPYLLSNGKGGEDNLGIRESGNKIPDVIDEAQNEVDFWLRLRDGQGGYATGLNNPSQDHMLMYQGAAKPYMAWASAANAGMLAVAYKVANRPVEAKKYVRAALEAWDIANGQDLDVTWDVGNGRTRGRDNRFLAATSLFAVTGEKRFEELIAKETVIKNENSVTEEMGKFNQQWGTAVYLMTQKFGWQKVTNLELIAKMRKAIISEAMAKHVKNSRLWPSRRSSDNDSGWFQSIIEVQKVCIAHAVATDEATRSELLRSLILEADYSLGRNPLNMILMTGMGDRSPDQIYTSGRNDGVPGVHPGHTPYMNSEKWSDGFMGDPRYYASRGFPAWEQWPQGEALWRAPYCYSNNEFTPQQAMRGKHVLYGYLYSLGAKAK